MKIDFLPRPVPGPIPAWTFPTGTAGRLGAGLGTLRCHLPGRRLASVRLALPGGAAREPAGLDGVAALTARTLMEGTEPGGGTVLTAALDRLGATLYASADLTAFRVALDVPVTRLPAALDLLGEVLRGPALADDDVRRLIRERQEEIAQEDADPGSRAHRQLRAAMFPEGSRISRPTGGRPDSVAALTGADVRAFYSAIDPVDAFAVVAGDIDGLDVDALLAAALGDWTSTGATLPAPDTALPVEGPRLVIVDRPGSVQSYLTFSHGVPGRDHPAWAPLTAACRVLGGGLTSRLNTVLREEKGYTYGFRAGLMQMRHCGVFVAQGSVHTEVTAAAVADTLTELRGVGERPVTAEERGTAVSALVDRAPAEYETSRAVAAELADALGAGLGADHPRRYLDAVKASTADDITRAYTEHVSPDALTVVAVGDSSQIRGPLEELRFSAITVIPAE